MKCRKCKCELTDCNAYIRNSPRAKQLGLEAEPVDHGYAYICLNPACKNYGKPLVKGLNFQKPIRFPFFHKLGSLSRKLPLLCKKFWGM